MAWITWRISSAHCNPIPFSPAMSFLSSIWPSLRAEPQPSTLPPRTATSRSSSCCSTKGATSTKHSRYLRSVCVWLCAVLRRYWAGCHSRKHTVEVNTCLHHPPEPVVSSGRGSGPPPHPTKRGRGEKGVWR